MSSFDDIALAYDDAIDWNTRLAREIPFVLTESLVFARDSSQTALKK